MSNNADERDMQRQYDRCNRARPDAKAEVESLAAKHRRMEAELAQLRTDAEQVRALLRRARIRIKTDSEYFSTTPTKLLTELADAELRLEPRED